MKWALKRLSASRFSRNFFSIFRANVFAQILAFASLPVLSRLYNPTDFGVLAAFLATLSVLSAVATSRFDWCVPNAPNKSTGAALVFLGLASLVVFDLVVVLLLQIGADSMAVSLMTTDPKVAHSLGEAYQLLPLAVLGTGVLALFKGWCVRENELLPVGRSSMLQSAVRVASAIVGGVAGLGAIGLVGANVASVWGAALALTGVIKGQDFGAPRRFPARVRLALRRFWKQAYWSVAVSLLNALSLSMPLVLVSYFYSAREAGWYSLMYTVALGPVALMTTALSQAYWAHAAVLAKTSEYRQLHDHFLLTTRKLAVASIPVTIGCAFAPTLIGPIFGEEDWAGAGYILFAMTPMVVGTLIFSPTNHLVVLERQASQLLADSLRIGMVLVAFIGSSELRLDVTYAVFASSLASLAGHLLLFYVHFDEHKRRLA